jgi:hypothetical protein
MNIDSEPIRAMTAAAAHGSRKEVVMVEADL